MPTNRQLSLYWKCQLIGWSAASLYWQFTGYIGSNFSFQLALIHFVADLVMYIGLTHLFRNISKHYGWQDLVPKKLLPVLIPSLIVLGAAYMLLTIGKTFLIRFIFETGFEQTFASYFKSQWLITLVTGIRLMAIWVLAYYLYHYAQREIKATKESARLALIAKDAQMDNLAAQLNPHFFFNSLNNIKALVLENPIAARRAIDLLSDLLRISLQRRDISMISLKEEMDLITDYLELEKIRFEERLQISIDVDEQLLATPVLPLSIQTLVENAIKHGIAQRKEGGSISINVQKQNGHLETIVISPGRLTQTNNQGLGLKNLSERLQLQFNGKASFELREQNDETISAIIKTPLA